LVCGGGGGGGVAQENNIDKFSQRLQQIKKKFEKAEDYGHTITVRSGNKFFDSLEKVLKETGENREEEYI
jgi:hypothetical protein